MAQKKSTPLDPDFLITVSSACQSAVTGSPPADYFNKVNLNNASARCLSLATADPAKRIKYLAGGLACAAVAEGVTLNQSFWLNASHDFWMNGLAVEVDKG